MKATSRIDRVKRAATGTSNRSVDSKNGDSRITNTIKAAGTCPNLGKANRISVNTMNAPTDTKNHETEENSIGPKPTPKVEKIPAANAVADTNIATKATNAYLASFSKDLEILLETGLDQAGVVPADVAPGESVKGPGLLLA